jgi:hypothetical protein
MEESAKTRKSGKLLRNINWIAPLQFRGRRIPEKTFYHDSNISRLPDYSVAM